jgi:hypothetical protein
MPFPGPRALPPVLGGGLVVWAGNRVVPLKGFVSRTLSSPPFAYVGLISYSLYLWHWPLLSLPGTAGLETNLAARIALVALAFVLSAASLRWIEDPIRHSHDPVRAAWISCAALFAAAAISTMVGFAERRASHTPERLRLSQALDWPKLETTHQTCPNDLRSSIRPSLDFCQTSAPTPVHGVVWGDSHADHLFPGLKALDADRSWLLLGTAACPPTVDIDVFVNVAECRMRVERALRWIERNESVQTVVMGFFAYYGETTDVAKDHRDNDWGPSNTHINGRLDRAAKMDAFAHGLEQAVRRLVMARKSVVIVIDVPELPFSPGNCYMKARIHVADVRCQVPLAEVSSRQKSIRQILNQIRERYPGVRVVDPIPVLCDAKGCGPGTSAAPMYRDSHHLSEQGSTELAKLILAETVFTN